MSEQLPRHGGEHHLPHNEAAATPERHKPTHEQLDAAERKQQAILEEMRELSESLAKSAEDMTVQQHGETKPQSHSLGVHKELKLENYRRILKRVQSRLKGPEKGFSKAVHNKQVDAISSVGAKTVARPIGVLTGGLAAFIGSLVVLVLARRYGFTYNFSLFIVLFIGGYLAGTILEGLVKFVKHRR